MGNWGRMKRSREMWELTLNVLIGFPLFKRCEENK